jgi:predicted HicB family RNase H-like nuclease
MTEAVIAAPVKVVPFSMRRNSNEDRIKQDEEELKELEKQFEEGVDKKSEAKQEDDEEPTNAEEKTFKKRYGDLRRHTQKIETELKSQVDALKQQLDAATKKEIKLPKSESELNAWASQYPDVYKIVETIAIKKAKEQSASLEERMKKVDEMEQQAHRSKAEAELMTLHPDFDQIRDDDGFHDWVEQQPKWVQQALYENDNDARAAARAIDLYKADKGIAKAKKADPKAAAMAVNTRQGRTTPTTEDTDGVFYESQINKMTDREFEAKMEDIEKARRAGKIVFDYVWCCALIDLTKER